MPSTALRIRIILFSLFSTAILIPSAYQPYLDYAWSFLRQTSLYKWSTFETIWTVFCYAVIEVLLTIIFMKHPELRLLPSQTRNSPGVERSGTTNKSPNTGKKPRGMRRPSRRLMEAVIYVVPLLAMNLTMVKKFADAPLSDILVSGNIDMSASLNPHTGLGSNPKPKAFLIPTFHNFTRASPLQTSRALPVAAPTSSRLVIELATSFLIYDALFFLFHLSLHIVPVMRRWHAPHHSHDAQINPQVTNQLSIPERLGLVLLANFSLNIIGAHVLTRTLFVSLFVWLLVEIHSGLELPWGYEKVLPNGWGGGAKKHMRHHISGDGGFEPFFCWWDGIWDWLSRFRKDGGGDETSRFARDKAISAMAF